MGIYIKSMEMPNSCLFCPLNSMKQCRITGGDITWATATRNRRGDCPLVPVQPNGIITREQFSTIVEAEESDMDSFIHIFEEDDEEDGMDSFIRILKE